MNLTELKCEMGDVKRMRKYYTTNEKLKHFGHMQQLFWPEL